MVQLDLCLVMAERCILLFQSEDLFFSIVVSLYYTSDLRINAAGTKKEIQTVLEKRRYLLH